MFKKLTEKQEAELKQLADANDGRLDPKMLVAAARKKTSSFYNEFEWDITKAAEQHWIETAKHIIRCSVTIIENDRPPIRTYVSLIQDRGSGSSYRRTLDVLRDEALRESLLKQAWDDLMIWRTRYERFKEFEQVFAVIDSMPKRPFPKGPPPKRQLAKV